MNLAFLRKLPSAFVRLMPVILTIFVYLLFRTPTPEYFLTDPDGGVQLAAAQQILLTGEQPWIDIIVPYGPLVYYASALGQWLSGGRLIGEITLVILGYGSAYVLLFLIASRFSPRGGYSWVILACALILMPRYYKYYVVLCPVLSLFAILGWLERPSRKKLVIIGLTVGFSFLFRADLGAFAALAATTAVLFAPSFDLGRRATAILIAAMGSSAIVVPWFVFVALRGELLVTLRDLWLSIAYSPKGMALPHPLMSWHDPRLTVLYMSFFVLPVVTATALIIRWKQLEHSRRAVMSSVVTLSLVCLTMASHRSDLAHLLQAIPVSLVTAAVLQNMAAGDAAWKWLPRTAMVCLVVITGVFLVIVLRSPQFRTLRFASPGPAQVARSIHFAFMDREEFLARTELENPSNWPLPVLRFVRESTKSTDRVCFWPFWSQLVYFSERPFAGLTTVLLPGRSDSPWRQNRVVAEMEDRPPALVLWDEDFVLDGDPSRQSTLTHSTIHDWVEGHCFRSSAIGRFSVFRCGQPVEVLSQSTPVDS